MSEDREMTDIVPISGDRGSRVITRTQLVEAGWVDLALFEIAVQNTIDTTPGLHVMTEHDVASGGVIVTWWTDLKPVDSGS